MVEPASPVTVPKFVSPTVQHWAPEGQSMVADPPVGTNQLVAAVALVDCWRAMIAIGKKMNFMVVVKFVIVAV
jgi:hypothetical protein